jgi:Amt family ammonium transporter
VEPWAAVVIGCIAGLVYALSTRLLKVLKVDDPLEASQVHGFGGILGVLVVGFFDRDHGVLYGHSAEQLGW